MRISPFCIGVIICIALIISGQTSREGIRKEIITLEGMDEEITTKLFVSGKGFSIYYDIDRFEADESEDCVKIYPKNSTEPSVNLLIIEHIKDISPEDLISLRMAASSVSGNFSLIYDGYELKLEDGNVIRQGYTVSNVDESSNVLFLSDGDGGTFVFTITCLQEAWEGFGQRFIYTIMSFSRN